MTHRLILTPQADAAADDIYGWLAERSLPGAHRWYASFHAALERLQQAPEVHGFAAENDLVAYDLREMMFKTRKGRPYRIVFTIGEAGVYVLHVRAPGQPLLTESELKPPQE